MRWPLCGQIKSPWVCRNKTNWRLVALSLGLVAILATFFHPHWPLPRSIHRYMFVLDITQSMNARDYHSEGLPAERLNYAKESIRRVLHDMPCGSEAGLGLFTTQNVQFLFEPIEICGHFSVIDDVLSHIDWRMAWAANSNVTSGLYAALRELAKRDPDVRLVFFTDGQETPPLSIKPSFAGKPGEIGGVLVGVGGVRPTVVPRYDRENRHLGDWQNMDIEPPPVSTTDYSEKIETHALPREGAYLSWLDEPHLKELSAVTGLRYHRLEDPARLSEILREGSLGERRDTDTDLRPLLGLLALVGLLSVYLEGIGAWTRSR